MRKTEVLVCRCSTEYIPQLSIDSTQLQVVPAFKYFESIVSSTNNINDDLNEELTKSHAPFAA